MRIVIEIEIQRRVLQGMLQQISETTLLETMLHEAIYQIAIINRDSDTGHIVPGYSAEESTPFLRIHGIRRAVIHDNNKSCAVCSSSSNATSTLRICQLNTKSKIDKKIMAMSVTMPCFNSALRQLDLLAPAFTRCYNVTSCVVWPIIFHAIHAGHPDLIGACDRGFNQNGMSLSYDLKV